MSAPTHREIARKDDLTVLDLKNTGGYLNAEQADAFIEMTLAQPTLLSDIRVDTMLAPKKKLESAGFNSRILHVASSGTAFTEEKRAKLGLAKVELDVKNMRANVRLPYDVVEDNIAKGNFPDWLMGQMSRRAALDMEEIIVLGDTSSGDEDLAIFNGVLKQATSHAIDNSGNPQDVGMDPFDAALVEMPSEFVRDLENMRFYVSPVTETLYKRYLASRGTALGDEMIQVGGRRVVTHQGIPVYRVPWMPNSKFLLTHRENIVAGIYRQILLETDKDIESEEYIFVLSVRFDVKYLDGTGVVKYTGLNATIPTV
ncbi:MAG: phage major capsid protein [Desulfomonile tiedjei]|nr:phage major capsid protein [Desulfomonile tiedjei]